jgi:bacillolysin
MRIILLVVFFGILLNTTAQSYVNKSAEKHIPGSYFVRQNSKDKTFEQIKFQKGNYLSKESGQVDKFLAKTLKTNKEFGYKKTHEEKDNKGFEHVKTIQTYKSIPIEGAVYLLHYKNNELTSVNGKYINGVMPSSIPSVSYNDAFKTACDSAKARKFIWQVDTSIQIQNLGKLVYLPLNDTTVHLAYKFDIYTMIPSAGNMCT